MRPSPQLGERPRWFRHAARGAACLFTAVLLLGCARLRPFRIDVTPPRPTPASAPEPDLRPDISRAPWTLAREDDYVVRIVAGSVTCSGTVIDADRVLTAHHCVSERDSAGNMLPRDVPATRIRVELGGDYLPWDEVSVRAIVAPSCGHAAGEGDVAILVLSRRLTGVRHAAPRLDSEPSLGELVEPMGFGRCAESPDAIHRNTRRGGGVSRLASGRFRLDAAICPGDSGGPGVSQRTGEVVGVISASVMDGSEQTRGLSEFTRLDRWRAVFANSSLIAAGASPAELPPIDCSAGRTEAAEHPR